MKDTGRRDFIRSASAGLLVASLHPATIAARQFNNNEWDWQNPIEGDPQRPEYHFLPPRGWMNDPNGLIHINGKYHLFYQFNPYGANMGIKHWGHARSSDLVHWEHLPIAIFPDQPYDEGGVYSGCMVNDNGLATAFYTGISAQPGQCIATSTDMIEWKKYEGNPVIATPPAGVNWGDFRDPYVWRQGDEWLMAVGASFRSIRRGTVLLYRSHDLREWEYMGPLFTGPPARRGIMFECPSFFPLGDKWILIISPLNLTSLKSNYYVGTFRDGRFEPECCEDLDLGGCLYAPQVFKDDLGRWIMFGWLLENRVFYKRHGWQGVQTLPRVITLGEDNRLRFAPADEVSSLRGQAFNFNGLTVGSGPPEILDGLEGDSLEIRARIEPGTSREFGIIVRRSPNGLEQTRISYNRSSQMLKIDRLRSSLNPTVIRSVRDVKLAKRGCSIMFHNSLKAL